MNEDNDSFFDQDRLIWRIADRVWDVLLLSVIFTLTCIPIVTIGASATAVYYVFLKIARGEDTPVLRAYWKSFKMNFKQATIMWLIMLVIGAGIGGAAYYYYIQNTTVSTVIMALFIGVAVIWLVTLMYMFPVLSRFSNRTGTLFFMSVFMPFKYFWYTVILLLIAGAFVFAGWYVIPFGLIAYGVYAFASSYIFVRVFRPAEEAIYDKQAAASENNSENKEIEEKNTEE